MTTLKLFLGICKESGNLKGTKGSVSSCPIMEVSLLAAVSFLECDK